MVNPQVGVDMVMSVNGSDWLWAVTAVYITFFISCSFSLEQSSIVEDSFLAQKLMLSLLLKFVRLVPSFTSHESKRVFNYILSMALLVGAVTYFAQASDISWSPSC